MEGEEYWELIFVSSLNVFLLIWTYAIWLRARHWDDKGKRINWKEGLEGINRK